MTARSSATSARALRGARDKLDESLRLSHVYGYESTGITRDQSSGQPSLLVILDSGGDGQAVPNEFEGLPVSIQYVDASRFDPEVSVG